MRSSLTRGVTDPGAGDGVGDVLRAVFLFLAHVEEDQIAVAQVARQPVG